MDILSPLLLAEPFTLAASPATASVTLTLAGLVVTSVSTPTLDTVVIAVRPG